MPGDAVQELRRFNRTVTQRVGALSDAYLASGRPLGASRVLWEIGEDGRDVRDLRTRLDLDSGYLSRLLRDLEGERLVVVEPDPTDRRVRTARLTAKGRTERELLDRRSDELAAALLAPLDERQQARLVEAMGVVERLLTAGLVDIAVEDPTSTAARFCIGSYFGELDERFDAGFDPAATNPADAAELTEPAGLLLVARLREEPVGCGALRLHGPDPAEVKRLWVAKSARGLGVGRRLLTELETHARRYGAPATRLDTNRALTEAINLYRSTGYVEIAAFNEEAYAHHWFEKQLRDADGIPGDRASRVEPA